MVAHRVFIDCIIKSMDFHFLTEDLIMHRYLLFSFALLIGITTSIPATAAADPCKKYLDANDLTSSKNGEKQTALYCYNKLLAKDTNNLTALAGLKEIETRYVKWAKRALKRGQKTKVERYLNSLRLVNPNSQALAELEAQAYPNRHPAPPAAPSSPVAEATPPEPAAPPVVAPVAPKQAKITDLGQIYEAINTTECLTWPSSEAKAKGGKNGWGSFYPKKGDRGQIVSEMKHCHLEDKVYLLKINKYYVAISSTGVEVVE
jgi:hypothetical protein